MSGADILLERPPGGWGDLVTNQTLDLRLAVLEERVDRKLDALTATMNVRFGAADARFAALDHRFDRFEHELLAQVDRRLRAQSWATISTIVAAMGILVAAVRL